jgi:glycosyltransferase involved in cell wall biosynthesis
MNNNKLLMIINEFPPTGLSGVQRALKFMKYACREGWEVHAVVPKKPVRKETDHSLLQEIPPEAHIHRVGGLGIRSRNVSRITCTRFEDTMPKNPVSKAFWTLAKLVNDIIWPIDKQIGWTPFAAWKAAKIIKHHKIHNLYITAYPFSSFVAGLWLKKRFGNKIFWVADYRDAWQFGPLIERKVHGFRMKHIRKMDEKFLRNSDRVIFVTEKTCAHYVDKYAWLSEKSEVITNGFDEDDFDGLPAKQFSEPTLVYMGRMDRNYGDPIPMLDAMAACNIPGFRFLHLGSIAPYILARIEGGNYPFYSYLGYLPHKDALEHTLGAWANLIMIEEDPESELVLQGKLFELLRAGRPILSLGPERSAIKDLIYETNSGIHVLARDSEAISKALQQILNNPEQFSTTAKNIEKFTRRELTRKLLSLYPKN